MQKFEIGDDVLYEKLETNIEDYDESDNTYMIVNPIWKMIADMDGDKEADDNIPYWIWVKEKELFLLT